MWSSRKPICVTPSTAEAEYVFLSECCTNVQGKLHFLYELNILTGDPPTLHVNDNAAITWVEKALGMRNAKHIDIRYHF